MQLQNHIFNFSEETKKNNTDNCNTINSANFQNSPNEKEINKNNIKVKEIEYIDNKNKFELNDINNININEKIHFSKNTLDVSYKSDSKPKSDEVKSLEYNNSVFNLINKYDNNYINNDNDKNFFNNFFHINNKYNNHNHNNKEIEKIPNEETNYNSINEKIYNIQNNSNSTHSQHINPPESNEYIYDTRNFKRHDFSNENSNSNFRKKTKNKKHFKVRYGDWICPKCENLNFSFRNKCNRCGLSKEKPELSNNNCQIQQQQNENNLDYQRPIMLNNININYILNSNYQLNNINIIYNPIYYNISNINNYYGNYNNFNIFYPCNVNIK